jgi:hypothetical protein
MTRGKEPVKRADGLFGLSHTTVLEVLQMAAVLHLAFVPKHKVGISLYVREVVVISVSQQTDVFVPHDMRFCVNLLSRD